MYGAYDHELCGALDSTNFAVHLNMSQAYERLVLVVCIVVHIIEVIITHDIAKLGFLFLPSLQINIFAILPQYEAACRVSWCRPYYIN